MTPPVSHCRRALQRQIAPPKDSVWITDGLLASAFERYCRVSRTWNRNASNVPGPLEGQRRLGRRRMGAASTWHCPPTPPSWAFLAPLNLSQWTWQPPSLVRDAGHDHPTHDDTAPSELTSLLSRWLRPPAPNAAEGPPMYLTSAASLEMGSPPPVTARADPYSAVMDDFRWAATHASDAALALWTTEMSSKFRQRIILGDISPGDIFLLSNEVWTALESRLHGSPLGHRLSLSFCRAIMSGLTASKVFSPTLMDARFWNTFLTEMSKFPADTTLCNLFVKVMRAIPVVLRADVEMGILSVVDRFFSSWSRLRTPPRNCDIQRLIDIDMFGELYENQEKLSALAPCLRQARVLSAALQAATPEQTKFMLSAAHRLAFNQAAASTRDGCSLRFGWLYMLARMPHVNEDFLFDAAASFCDPSLAMRPLSITEVSSLLLTQWTSRGYLRSPLEVYHAFRRHRGRRDDAALASLFLAIFRRGQDETRKGLYRSAWKFLSRLQQKDHVVRSLCFDAQTGTLPVRMLEDLAHTSNDHRIAIRLRDLWSNHLRTRDQPEWYPGVFEKYAHDIIHDQDIPTKEIWRVLDIGKLERQDTTPHDRRRRHRNAFGARRAAVVEKMARSFMTAPKLSNRAAVRHVSRSFAFLRVVRGNVPDYILQDLYRLVTRDLWEEKPGRTKRLLWFLRLVERTHGMEMAWSCRKALRKWRYRLTMAWLAKGGRRWEEE